ncbi:CesT family type III secretion system chaperone [Ramlibacter sp. AW1]|uniref:CesT family type III secretion system chaperone n=1 Tax=Ramlibacter aurantiacus TaxID=2801330 RepID=A0A936ZTN7_9BURK|nr:CesT family type III secretion system chaperone [Ramlibacter aurantiacus]MBL0420419.1 CesT family type III secretion system chaperone [Ramlibacter aurantiacus]
MTTIRFEAFCQRVCDAMGVELPGSLAQDPLPPAITLTFEGVEIGLIQASFTDDEHAILLVEFGPLPTGREREACEVLLGANFLMMGTQPPVFSMHPETGSVYFHHGFRLTDADPAQVQAQAHEMVAAVQRWRSGEFVLAGGLGDEQAPSVLMAAVGTRA